MNFIKKALVIEVKFWIDGLTWMALFFIWYKVVLVMPFPLQGAPLLISRRWCLCTTLSLINASGSLVSVSKGDCLEMMDGSTGKERAVCRNCGGSGAIICKSVWYFCILLSLIFYFGYFCNLWCVSMHFKL